MDLPVVMPEGAAEVRIGAFKLASGVPMLEHSMAKRRPGYAEYVARTSAFVPRPPKKA